MTQGSITVARPTEVVQASDRHAALECRRILGHHSKSFALAGRLLPNQTLDKAAVVYAFCRAVDDYIDEAPPAETPERVAELRGRLASLYSGRPQSDPVFGAFQRVARERNIFVQYPDELLAGMAMDAAGTQYETLDDLLLYCYRVAGVVGLMMCHVLGVRHERALRRAAHLGMAMQLTNICRDVTEDWERGRLYLPAEELARAGAPNLVGRLGQPFPVEHREAFARTLDRLLREADRYYRSGDEGLVDLPFRAAVAIRTARGVYSAIGDRLRAQRLNVLSGRAIVPRSTKLRLAAIAMLRESCSLPRRAVTPFEAAQLSTVVRFPDDVICE